MKKINHCFTLLTYYFASNLPTAFELINDKNDGHTENKIEPNSRVHAINEQRLPFKPSIMLANQYDRSIDVQDYWVSEKLDGVRCYWDGKQLWTRAGHPIPAPDSFTKDFPNEALDGELWMGHGQFETISSLVRRQRSHPDDWKKVTYFVFDLPDLPLPFGQRLAYLGKKISVLAENSETTSKKQQSLIPHLQLVPQVRVNNHASLMKKMRQVVQAGGEGLMLHKDASLYRGFRSNDLIKVKPHYDAEAIVIAHLPGRGKHHGRLGSILVKTENGLQFKIGTGFSDQEREAPPPVGSEITFQYSGKTKFGKPRFPRFLRLSNKN